MFDTDGSGTIDAKVRACPLCVFAFEFRVHCGLDGLFLAASLSHCFTCGQELRSAMEALGYKDKNKMVYQMIENIQVRLCFGPVHHIPHTELIAQGDSITFEKFLDMMTARIVRLSRPAPTCCCTFASSATLRATQTHARTS